MRKSIFVVVLSLVAVLAVACGGNNAAKGNGAKSNGATTDGGACGGGGGDAADALALYKKEGRSWTVKNVTKIEGMDDMVSYSKSEVVKVTDAEATVKMTNMDKDKKPMGDPTEYPVKFDTPKGETTGDAPKVEIKEETIKVEAGEFACTVTELSGTKTWMSKEFPGLMVKSEHAAGSSELIEFNK
jgi:hypothetical protein